MKIADLGEFKFIDHLSRLTDISNNRHLDDGVVGIGDDCAVIPKNSEVSTLVTTDMMMEDVHFIRSKIPPEELGHKLLAVNLSDIAAMGGTPAYAFLSMALVRDLDVDWLDRFFLGFKGLAEKFGVHLLGGDTTGSFGKISLNLTLMGEARIGHIKFRSGAKPGDLICVVGNLGDSAAGLKVLLEDITPDSSEIRELIGRHHSPIPRVSEGQWLAGQTEVHAMMDISDGLSSDIRRVMSRSACGARIELTRLPVSDLLRSVSTIRSWSYLDLAWQGGEDYGLLVIVDPQGYDKIAKDFLERFDSPLSSIGEITETQNNVNLTLNGKPYATRLPGFTHFGEQP